MSERKRYPSASRRCTQAPTSAAGSTTSVVSPCASTTSTSPGVASRVIVCASVEPTALGPDAPDLVCGWDSRLHGLVEADDALHQLLGPGGAARHVDVDGNDLVDALD